MSFTEEENSGRVFSDADLKRLKEVMVPGPQDIFLGVVTSGGSYKLNINALLARLEAAELCLELPHMKHTEDTDDMKCMFCTRYKARRAALEEAAKIVEENNIKGSLIIDDIAKRIRALMEKDAGEKK